MLNPTLSGSYVFHVPAWAHEPDADNVTRNDGDLFLRIEPDGSILGSLTFPTTDLSDRAILDVAGAVDPETAQAMHLVARGRANSATAEHACVIVGRHTPDPATGGASLCGTIARMSPVAGRGQRFVATRSAFVEPGTVPGLGLAPAALAHFASHPARLRYMLWNMVRACWWQFDADQQSAISAMGCGVEDPPFQPDGHLDLANGAGEDFLFAHRGMIRSLHRIYHRIGRDVPAPWVSIPTGTGPQIAFRPDTDPVTGITRHRQDNAHSGNMVPPPVPRGRTDPDPLVALKSRAGFNTRIQPLAACLRSPRFAASRTLGAYGSLIEFTLRNTVLVRWANGHRAQRPQFDFDRQWCAASFDRLDDFYGCQANPLFWRLHGWIDHCIEIWFAAHEAQHPGEVRRARVDGIDWFEPGKWVEKPNPSAVYGATVCNRRDADVDRGGLQRVLAICKQNMATTSRVSPARLIRRDHAETLGALCGPGGPGEVGAS